MRLVLHLVVGDGRFFIEVLEQAHAQLGRLVASKRVRHEEAFGLHLHHLESAA